MYVNPVSRASGRAQHAGDIKRGMGTARGGEELASARSEEWAAPMVKNALRA